ncbi:MAG: AEC family transporter [Chthoniobacter sp.]|uniref:AEC family transporter n=1 Tax=Chthoniobacter sp. TaxID=2510640 RepID=UPI0032A2ACA0
MFLWSVFTHVLLPILVMVSFGWLIDRRSRLDLSSLVKLNIYLFVPAFIFVNVVDSNLSGAAAARIMGFTACIIASMFVLSALVGRGLRYEPGHTRALQLATMFYNSGNYGIPLMALAYPITGPLLQVFIVLTQNICTFTVGLALAASTHRSGWRLALPMLRQVSLWAVLSAFTVRFFHLPVQQVRWLWVPLHYLSEALVAFALITLGVQLSQTQARQNLARLGWALGLRLLVGPLIAVALVPVFGFTGQDATIMIVSSSFPTAVNTALIAHEFQADSQFAAAVVFYSTLFSMFTVTVLIAILR